MPATWKAMSVQDFYTGSVNKKSSYPHIAPYMELHRHIAHSIRKTHRNLCENYVSMFLCGENKLMVDSSG